MRLHTRHFATWLALLSICLYALWPLLAMVQPRGLGAQYALCPHSALLKMAEEGGKQQPSSNPISNHRDLQCAFALGVGDGASAAPTATIVHFAVEQNGGTILDASISPFRKLSRFYATAPRGPPRIS